MLCPHCGRTIQEQDEYLMSVREEHVPWDSPVAKWLIYGLVFVVLIVLFAYIRKSGVPLLHS